MLVLASVFGNGLEMCGAGDRCLGCLVVIQFFTTQSHCERSVTKKKTTQKVFHKKLKSLSNLEFNALKKNSKQQNN